MLKLQGENTNMSVHTGVSCNTCDKTDFSGKRYKCLRCLDFDLCAVCYYARRETETHLADHPVQCILTNADYALYYGGENLQTIGQIQSYTCPLCGKMGFTESTLKTHVMEHPDEEKFLLVLCPMCCTSTGADSELIQDISTHLMLEHSSDLQELALLFDEPERPRRGRVQSSTARIATSAAAAAASGAVSNIRSRHSHGQGSNGRGVTTIDEQRFPNLLMLLLDRAELRSARRSAQAARHQILEGHRAATIRRISADRVIADRLSLVPDLDPAHLMPILQEPFIQSSLIVEAAENSGEMMLPIPERHKSEATVTTSSATETRAQTASVVEQETHQFLLPAYIQEKEKEGLATEEERGERAMFVRDLLLSTAIERESSELLAALKIEEEAETATNDTNEPPKRGDELQSDTGSANTDCFLS